uniref:F-box DNA helicase 1 n=1 Tax=Poecilia reticulata TaxID=8081 RepID=A0A3P9PW80_POERE
MPSTSTHRAGSGVVFEDDDDDVSLLATPTAAEVIAEDEDEIDDDSLLAAEMLPEKVSSADARLPEADYLEGMTAEMFGDDEDFDDFEEEEVEVEPLPDAHFGLLSSDKVLLHPQGCVGDLPEEVLREVLCLVPAADLYRNVCLVCHRWRNIVLDPKFVPFKKQYFRYMMKEKETVLEVCSTLKNSNITCPAPSEHSIRNLVVLMAQHKVGERVKPDDVLSCVKKHRLFPQAEAAIRLRIPDIQKFLPLGIEVRLRCRLRSRFRSLRCEPDWQGFCLTSRSQYCFLLLLFFCDTGTGKTTTLVRYAAQRPHLRFLYVAFNNSVASEARRRFPPNVDCKTAHSLAYSDVGRRYKTYEKLTFNVKPFSINLALTPGAGGYSRAKVVTTILNAFMASADQTIGPQHVPYDYAICKGHRKIIEPDEQQFFIAEAKDIWNKMKDVREKSKQAYYMPHDGYLKLWQLRDPKPCLTDRYDAIFIDEAQDCTPAIMDVLLAQRCGKILVGDPHQQIYTFKGAVNALRAVHHTHIFYLTQSFRFGAEIAFVGAAILKVCKGVKKILVGGMQKSKSCRGFRGKIGVLSRCNLGVFKGAVQLTDANQQCRIHFIGVSFAGLQKKTKKMIRQGMNAFTRRCESKCLPSDALSAIKDPLIRTFFSSKRDPYLIFKDYIIQTEDKELDGKLSIVEKYRERIPELVARLKACAETDFHQAAIFSLHPDFIVGTVHKAKGLEFDTVIVTDDFASVPASGHNLCRIQDFSFYDEWNLLYVAVTRAMSSLVITKNILRILTVAGVGYDHTVHLLHPLSAHSPRKVAQSLFGIPLRNFPSESTEENLRFLIGYLSHSVLSSQSGKTPDLDRSGRRSTVTHHTLQDDRLQNHQQQS